MYTPQATPTVATCEWWRVQALSASGVQVGMVDGSVRNVRTSVSQAAWSAASTPNGGEVLPSDW